MIHLQGDLTPVNYELGIPLLQRACDGEIAQGCAFMGLMFHHGQGAPSDPETAARYLLRACDLGDPTACQMMGR
ncbi:MAG: hypothetical protein P8P99_08425 [Maricaulis sp.]|jgi:hypothetical protein|nr:hypothetical protein [Maricaulis sp.]